MKEFIPVLKQCSLFRLVEEKDLQAMLSCLQAKVRQYHKGDYICSEGSPAEQIGIILSGMAQISRDDYYGNRSVLGRLKPSDLFGETFAFAGVKEFPLNVTAVNDVEVLFIDSNRIISPCSHACGFHTRLIYNLLNVMAQKNLGFHQKIQITSKRTTREKLMAFLTIQAQAHDSSTFEIPFDRQALADYLEVDRSGLSAEISKLRKEGVLECHRSTFTLL